jgi:hypothetical protein
MCGRFPGLQSECLSSPRHHSLGPALLFGSFRPRSQNRICTIFEKVLVAWAEGIWAIALDVDGSDDFAGGGMENRQICSGNVLPKAVR